MVRSGWSVARVVRSSGVKGRVGEVGFVWFGVVGSMDIA